VQKIPSRMTLKGFFALCYAHRACFAARQENLKTIQLYILLVAKM